MWPSDSATAGDWLRDRLARGPDDGWHERLPPRHADDAVRAAAVLVPLVWHADGPTVLLTRRSDSLPTHAGQISFPGGKAEPGDASPIETALREANEEIGLAPTTVSVLGTLPRYVTITGFAVVPVVGLVRPPVSLTAAPGEVAEIFELPLARVLTVDAYQTHDYQRDGFAGQYLSLPYGRYFIWGATAAMLRLLALTLGGR